jgi:hypothetical protein
MCQGITETRRMPDIKYYSKRIFQIGLAPGRAVVSLIARCFHMILHDILLNYSKKSDFWKLVFQLILNMFDTPPNMTSA